jgi:hypothetical protein
VSRLNAQAEIRNNPWMADSYQSILRNEQRAVGMQVLAEQVLPALLQTEEYAVAINKDSRVGIDAPGTYDAQVRLRMARKGVLSELAKPALFVVTEQALRFRPLGLDGRDYAAQMEQLAAAAEGPQVDVRALPAELYDRKRWNRMISRFRVPVLGRRSQFRDVLHVEMGSDAAVISDGDVMFQGVADEIEAAKRMALPPEESAVFLRKLGGAVLRGQ